MTLRRRMMMWTLSGLAVALAWLGPAAVGAVARARLAYANGGRTYVSGTDGRHARAIGPEGDGVVISPNGREVATVRGRDDDLYVYPVAGGHPQEFGPHGFITSAPGVFQVIAFSPDSRYVAVSLDSSAVEIADLRTGQVVATFARCGAGSWAPRRPDRFAAAGSGSGGFGDGTPLQLWNASNKDITTLASLVVNNPVWGAQKIAVERRGQIWTVNPVGRDLHQITHLHATGIGPAGSFTGITPALWSPGGRQLLADDHAGVLPHECLLTLRTGRCRAIVVRGSYVDPVAFNSRGTGFLVGFGPSAYAPPGLAGQIATMNLTGGDIHLLVGHGVEPSWTL